MGGKLEKVGSHNDRRMLRDISYNTEMRVGDPAPLRCRAVTQQTPTGARSKSCGSEFIREEAGTSDASSSPGTPLSRMNSLPQSLCDSVSCALFDENEFIRERGSTSGRSSSPGMPLSRMNSLPQFAAHLVQGLLQNIAASKTGQSLLRVLFQINAAPPPCCSSRPLA